SPFKQSLLFSHKSIYLEMVKKGPGKGKSGKKTQNVQIVTHVPTAAQEAQIAKEVLGQNNGNSSAAASAASAGSAAIDDRTVFEAQPSVQELKEIPSFYPDHSFGMFGGLNFRRTFVYIRKNRAHIWHRMFASFPWSSYIIPTPRIFMSADYPPTRDNRR